MDKLKFFLYLLIRDELPCGKVERMVSAIEKIKGVERDVIYSNSELAQYAASLAERLKEE
jgi:hypothetical protein